MKEQLRVLIEDTTTKKGKVFDYIIQILILISVAAVSIETLPNNTDAVKHFLKIIEIISVIIFSIEYIVRVTVAKKPLKYIFSFYGIIDLLAIAPFYLSSAVGLTPLRIFRIFRIFRTLKLIRYNKALSRFAIAFKIIKEEMILFFIVMLIIIFISASGIYYFENEAQPEKFSSIFHSLWWTIITLTTVGYGDAFPITIGGKIFTSLILLIGIGIITIPTGLIATALTKAREIEKEQKNNETTNVK